MEVNSKGLETEVIKKYATPRLQRATVHNQATGKLETAPYRVSKSAWLQTHEHKLITNYVRRAEKITGLNMKAAEELQVVNYGIGGQYEPHFDFARREEKDVFPELGWGNRIATWMSYLSDVDAGGSTVFVNLNIQVKPKRNSAIFWFNLKRNGEGDLRTRHAACPVLAGTKWVANKWIHERGQEFVYPCGATENEIHDI